LTTTNLKQLLSYGVTNYATDRVFVNALFRWILGVNGPGPAQSDMYAEYVISLGVLPFSGGVAGDVLSIGNQEGFARLVLAGAPLPTPERLLQISKRAGVPEPFLHGLGVLRVHTEPRTSKLDVVRRLFTQSA